ncbi:LCP family protein [Halalkalibacillus sediminis]|nr:LCP family protein [Halalkalibacillus sediminis]
MDKKSNKLFSSFEDENLTFTKEDRLETFQKIKRNNKSNPSKKRNFLPEGKRIAPVMGTVMVLILAIGLFLPNLYSGNEVNLYNSDEQQATTQKENLSFSALLMSNGSNHRSNINILLTYNGRDRSVKLVPIPRDTYVQVIDSEGKMLGKDKLMHASALNGQPETVLNTVSNLFDISVDYYSVIAEEKIYEILGIKKDSLKDNSLLVNEVGNSIEEQASKINNLLEVSDTNIPNDITNDLKDSSSDSIKIIDMEEGIEKKVINGIYYLEINQEHLLKTKKTLKQHLSDEK